MGFYGNITNTSKTQFQFDLTYSSRVQMEKLCKNDGVYIGRYVLVDYDTDPNKIIKDVYRKGNLADFKEKDFLYVSKNFEENLRVTFLDNDYWDYDWDTTDTIYGVVIGSIVRVTEENDQIYTNKEGKTITVLKGQQSFYKCVGYETEMIDVVDPVSGELKPIEYRFATFEDITGNSDEKDPYLKNYEEDRNAYGSTIGRGWDSTVWQKVYENGVEKYVMIAELNSVVPTFDIQADAPSMSPLTPHFDEETTNVYYKLHWQPQWGLRTRASNGELKTYQLDKNGKIDSSSDPIYTSSSIDLAKAPAERYPSDAKTKWEKYEYDGSRGAQVKYAYNKNDQVWEEVTPDKDESNYQIDAAIFWNDDGFYPEVISNTTQNRDESNKEWDGETDFISIKPTGWSGHQYSQHKGNADRTLQPAPDTQELMVMLPSIGNAISKVWDIVYGDIEINNGENRNLNINWENPEKNISRKGLRLIHDKYVSITEKEMVAGYQPHIYYKWNENINDYELATDESWPMENEERVQLYTRSGAGQTYDPGEVKTLAGAINSVHDLMGMIIVDQDPKMAPEDTEISNVSSDRIYYYPMDGSYRIKDFKFEYTNLDEGYFEYITAEDFYIAKYNIVDEEEKQAFKLTEKEFAPDMFYTFDGDNYIPLNEESIFDENEKYYVKQLKINNDEIFKEVDLDTFTSGWYKTSTGSYIYKRGGTVDDGVVYYTIDDYKLVDHEYESITIGTETQFISNVKTGLFIKKIINGKTYFKKLTSDDVFDQSAVYYIEKAGYESYWPRVFEDGETYVKDSFYYLEKDAITGRQVFSLMNLDTCDRNKAPFYKIPQKTCEKNYPFLNYIDNTKLYDQTMIYEPEDEQEKATWKGPYKPLEGYWDIERGEWVEDSYIYPTYFFNFGTFYARYEEGSEVTGEESQVGGVTYRVLLGIPTEGEDAGFGYILDRPRTNTSMPQEAPSYGNPIGAYRVKLIDYDMLSEDVKSHLYYADVETFEDEVELEDGTIEIKQKTRFLKWIPVKKADIEEWYKDLGYRKGGANSDEPEILKPKKQIYYIEYGAGVKDLYEENRYFYKVVNDNEPSYIRDRNTEFTDGVAYYNSEYFTMGEDRSIHAIVPLGDSGEYYAPNKYYYYDEAQEEYVIDTSLTARENVQYYKRNDIYISEDLGGFFQKGSSWNMNAEAIPHSVSLSKRVEVGYMKELESYGRSYNTINGLILELNRKLATDKPDTRDRSTLQGAINYLNDVAAKVHDLTPGDLPLVDNYGRIHGGSVETDEWIDVKIDPNADSPRMIVTHEYNPIPVNNTQHDMNGNGDTVSWPIYEYDDMGHMVGSAIHTETLPYNFKTIKVTNTEDDAVNAPNIEINQDGQIADNTQDTLTFSASNRWIKLDNNTEDTVKIGHLLSPFIDETVPNHLYGLTQDEDHTKYINDLGDLDKDNTFEVPCFQFDEAGHILEARTHTVTLPELYNKFNVSAESDAVINMEYQEGTITADNMNDSITFTPGNKWIHMAVSGIGDETVIDTDTIKIAHEVSDFKHGEANKEYGLLADETISDTNNKFEIPTFEFDEAGHIRGARTHTLTLPFGFTKFAKAVHTTVDNVDKTEGGAIVTVEPDTMTDTITFGNGNKWICIDANAENDSFTFSHYVKDFTEGSVATDLNENGTFTVQELGWDRAGHLISSNKRTYTLPYNFKTVEVIGTSNVVENSTSGSNGTIVADTHIDTLTLTPGNKWIQLVGNADSDTVTFKHYVNKFTETTATTDNNTLNNNTVSTQELSWDEAGHLVGSVKRTYTLPYNFKTFTVTNEGNGITTSGVATNGKLVAEDQIDEITLTSGNRWITLIADISGRKATIDHATAGVASISKGDTSNQTPKFGSTFKVLSAGIDQTGHVSSLEEHTVQIPLPSLNNDTVGGTASVLTKLSLEDTTGAFSTEHKNVGELLITGYSVASNVESIAETDSINSAFGKVQKALNILNADNATENSINYKVKNAIDDLRAELQDNCDEEFKTFKLIQDQITDGSEETIINRVKSLEEKSLPEYKNLEDEGVYLMKMVDGNPTWIKLESWNGGKY